MRGRHTMRRRTLLGAIGALPVIASRHAAAGPPVGAGTGAGITDALVKAAQQEGTLTYYHVTSIDVTGAWTGAFSKRFGVRTKNVRGPGYPTWDKWLNESRVGLHICDAIQVTDPSLIDPADREGFVAHYTPEAGPKILPDMKQDGIWYAIHANVMGLAWNTQKASAEDAQSILAQGWDALGDPRWKGRYGTTTPASGGSDYVFWYMFMVALNDRYGDPWLQPAATTSSGGWRRTAAIWRQRRAGIASLWRSRRRWAIGLAWPAVTISSGWWRRTAPTWRQRRAGIASPWRSRRRWATGSAWPAAITSSVW
jgi:iron(III) transport system substrate-binding protein